MDAAGVFGEVPESVGVVENGDGDGMGVVDGDCSGGFAVC